MPLSRFKVERKREKGDVTYMKISSACPICRQVGFVVVKPNGICDTPQGRYDIWIHPMPQRIGRTYSVVI